MNDKLFNYNIFKNYANAVKEFRLSKLSDYSFDLYDSLYKSYIVPLKNICETDEAISLVNKIYEQNKTYKSFYQASFDKINLLLYNDFKKIIKKYNKLYREKTLPSSIKYLIGNL